MKRLFVSFLAFVMVLSLAACGQQKPSADDVDLTAPEVLEQLKAALGEADWFLGEAKKVDAAWSDIFGTAGNQIVQ